MKAQDRCTSQWQQLVDSTPVIRCARNVGHTGWHFNTREQRQWESGNRPEWTALDEPSRYVSTGPCSEHRIVGCPCVGPIAQND